MSQVVQESGASPKTSTIMLWLLMSLGPDIFFLSLLTAGVWLFGLDRGWWPASDAPPSDPVLFGPVIAVILAELIGAAGACVMRRRLAGTAFETHASSAIRTFWIMVAGFAIANAAAFSMLFIPNIDAVGLGVTGVLIMIVTMPLLFVWKLYRIFRGLSRAAEGKPFAGNPSR